ncbi:glycoside hydrolase family 32 protein [Jeotgalibacillus salarius]|uniref:Glycoside hydrolase family 32 protein n=1 Tax=Jeotgalibacillus salarius TaxID=546023 RepID=A0A4Y8LE86_9BACL|nr:glycoside hydrolase family 32 protein [Jeotgalibacillus salarius]TFE00636.1 glycoside hydrolase family 32 protein [Jeotgalibacillus salarius]
MSVTKVNPSRPYLHYAPEKNWMNDPNGLVFFNNEYHLFYQYHPNGTTWGPMHWGHAVSRNLIDWEELPIALYPDQHGMIFSGSAVVDWHNTTGFFDDEPGLVAIFTHHKDTDSKVVQSQSLAYSLDDGRTWIKYKGNPVLSHPTNPDFRDPKVFWHHETDKWIMVLATDQTISIYSSQNLINWVFESEFGTNIGSHEGVWECPDLFALKVEGTKEVKWVMIVSIGDGEGLTYGSRTQYFTGSFNGKEFISEHSEAKWLDYGRDQYAGVTFSDIPQEDSRRMLIGWMSNWRYANQVPTEGWRSQMTLPRELTLKEFEGNTKLVQHFPKELDNWFNHTSEIERTVDSSGLNIEVEQGPVYLSLNTQRPKSGELQIALNYSEQTYTLIQLNFNEKKLSLKRSKSGRVNFSELFSKDQELFFSDIADLQLTVVIDTFSVELLLNEGEYALTSLQFPNDSLKNINLKVSTGEVSIRGMIKQ